MAKKNLTAIATKIHDHLKPLESEERQRVIAAALTLLGEKTEFKHREAGDDQPPTTTGIPQSFFDSKQPQTKIEELAVAARFRELNQRVNTHTKNDFQTVVTAARRNFDSNNFKRDINNAKVKGLFTKGRDIMLSHYGQKYVDALPNREVAKKLRKPKTAGRKRKVTRKKKG